MGISNIKQLYSEWKSLQPLKPEDLKRWNDKFKLEFNYNSNHLEGNTLTYGQTKLLLMFGETSGNASLKDYEEMKAHNVGLEMIKQEAQDKERPLTESFIRELNRTILVQDYWKNAKTPDGQDIRMQIKVGEYKSRPNSVLTATGEVFSYASPEETPAFMTSLVDWYNLEADKGILTPVELAALLHYRYIRIHPFEDGNGRIARLLVNFVLHRYGYPMIVIHSEDKSNYLNILHQCDVEAGLTPSDGANATLNDILPFVNYLSSCLIRSLTLAIKAAKGESIEEEGDFEKKIAMLQRRYSDKAIEKSSRSVEQARSAFFELAVYVEQKISGLQKLFDRTFITNTPTWNMARKINTPNPDEPIIQSHILYTKSKEYGFVEDIIRLSKKSLVDYFKLKYDAVTFHFNHCRYAGDNTFDFPFCIYIQYLSDGCEVSCDIIPNSVKLPYNPNVLAEEGKEYMDTACNELLKLLEEKMNDKSPEN